MNGFWHFWKRISVKQVLVNDLWSKLDPRIRIQMWWWKIRIRVPHTADEFEWALLLGEYSVNILQVEYI
jgi:hypothetical protein